MSTPITQYVQDRLVTLLRTIQTATGDNTTPDVQVASFEGNSPANDRVVLYELDSESLDTDGSSNSNRRTWITTWQLAIYVMRPGEDDSAWTPEKQVRLLQADIIKKLMSDYQLSNYIANTLITGKEMVYDSDGSLQAGTLTFTTQHREDINDPFIQRA